jgi:hypothetical protein
MARIPKRPMLDQAERVIRARIAGVPVAKIARDEGIGIAAVNKLLDDWVEGLVGPELRRREFGLALQRNDELIEFLRVKALSGGPNGRNWVREYSAALSKRNSLLALRPPRNVNLHIIAEETQQRATSFDRLDGALRALIEQRPKTLDG